MRRIIFNRKIMLMFRFPAICCERKIIGEPLGRIHINETRIKLYCIFNMKVIVYSTNFFNPKIFSSNALRVVRIGPAEPSF